jgi:polyhydroxyalkanoate synthesis regulator phasin
VISKPIQYSTGNTLSEYGLVGSLILLICIAGFLTAGSNLNAIFGALKQDMAAHREIAESQAAITTAAALKATSTSGATPLPRIMGDLSAEDMALLGQDLSNKLQTTGANGTTQLLATQLELLAKQMLEQGKISQAESDAILRLANQGHRFAHMEGLIEDAIRMSNGNMDTLRQSTVNMDGQSYLIGDLAHQIGFGVRKPYHFSDSNILTDYPEAAQPEMAKFRELYQEALSGSAMSDPAIRATIESAATQIAMVAESVEDNMWAAINMSNDYPIRNLEEFNNKIASSSTQMNASKICRAGDYQDNQVICTK